MSKVLLYQFLGKQHSWSCFGWGIATALKQLGYDVHLFSTDGVKCLPKNLQENLIGYQEENQPKVFGRIPDRNYDCQISYTCVKNFTNYFVHSSKNRFGTWVYEWKNALPIGFAKHYKAVDFVCPPSNFGKQIFVDAGVPEDRIVVIPHGINSEEYRKTDTIKLPTKKRVKILANIIQNHTRKNIPGLLDAYGKAFTDKDDVCLILKGKEKRVTQGFEISLNDAINDFKAKYPRHGEMKVFSEFIPDISSLYRSVDAVFSMSYCEGFLFPMLEALAAAKTPIAPNWGGQTDFLNADNAMLICGKEERADEKSMYWQGSNNAIWFKPSIDDAVDKLRYVYTNYEALNERLEGQRNRILVDYDWSSITKQFMDLCI